MPPAAKAREVGFSHLDKIFFPKVGFTKGQMIKYYLEVAPYILPHLRDRPVTLIRFPDGIAGPRFYEKNAPRFAPDWIRTAAVGRRHEAGTIHYLLINDAATLAWCANIAGLEIHPFLHRFPRLERPTCVAFDFDPGAGADLVSCGQVAIQVREILEELGLKGFPKVSGSKGLQVYVPLNGPVTYAVIAAFAKAVAELLEQRHPDLVVSGLAKRRRRGKVLIDWSQNNPSKTTVAVYSMRGKADEPFISMPVTWEELTKMARTGKKQPLFFTPEAAIKRLKKVGDLFAPVLTLRQSLPRAFARLGAPPDPLGRYRDKRDFAQTREPRPSAVAAARGAGRGRFVIQKHAASHLHYDFRLEMDGTLKSWAIPKGLPMELGVKRSAFQVEDHPVGYIKFEGTIPQGQYGGGTVMVWDIGTYALLSGSLAEGSLKLLLQGRRLRGEWHLFRIRSDDIKPVWLIAKSGRAAPPISARQDDRSVLTSRSMARISRDNDQQWKSRPPRRS